MAATVIPLKPRDGISAEERARRSHDEDDIMRIVAIVVDLAPRIGKIVIMPSLHDQVMEQRILRVGTSLQVGFSRIRPPDRARADSICVVSVHTVGEARLLLAVRWGEKQKGLDDVDVIDFTVLNWVPDRWISDFVIAGERTIDLLDAAGQGNC